MKSNEEAKLRKREQGKKRQLDIFPLFVVIYIINRCLGLWPNIAGQIRGALQVGLVALAQRFLVLKWISARQSTPTLQKGESLTANCLAS